MVKEQKAISRNCPRGIPDDRLTRQDFKSAIINIFEELKEAMPNKLKESIRTLYQKNTEYSHPARDWFQDLPIPILKSTDAQDSNIKWHSIYI